MVTEELRKMEEEKRMAKAVSQSQQGAWTMWEEAADRNISWASLRSMDPLRISMLLRYVYDLLPTPSNLQKLKITESGNCNLCGKRGTLEHVLASCGASLQKYTWRHNQVLAVLDRAVRGQCAVKGANVKKTDIQFLKAGETTRKASSDTTGVSTGHMGGRV